MRLKINYPYIIFGVFLIKIILYVANWILLIFGIIYLLPIVLFRVANNRFIKLLYLTISILSTAILARLFLFELYNIPSNSMTNSLFLNDKVFVSKLHYGSPPPETPFEIPWINILFYMNAEARERMDENWWKTERLPGFQNVKRGEIFVFKSPWEGREYFIKRCVAIPGDTFMIKHDQVYINE